MTTGVVERLLPRNSIQRVAVKFVLLLSVFMTIALVSRAWTGWAPITSTVASAAGGCARLVGLDATVDGNVIRMPSMALAVDPQCTAVDLLAVYAAIVLAYPLRWKQRLLALIVGLLVLQVANVLRLVGVAWASSMLTGRAFYLVHDYLFQFGMVFVAMVAWAVWLTRARTTT